MAPDPAAGVLALDPDPTGIAQDYRLTLQPGHASAFRENDLIRLRRRPLFPNTLVSDVMRVKTAPTANQAHLDVTVLFTGWTSPGSFEAGSVHAVMAWMVAVRRARLGG